MRLTECEFEKLLPLFMREEADNIALARAIDPIIREIGEKIALCSDFENIDLLPEDFVDALASELSIDWYKKNADISVKRELVKNSDAVHRTLGTKAAVEQVVSDYYGSAKVQEWFEYGGEPGHFRIVVNEEQSKIVFPEELHLLISKVKKASAVLDEIDFHWNNYETMYAAVAETHTAKWPDIFISAAKEDLDWAGPLTIRVGVAQTQTLQYPDIMMQKEE